MFLRFVLDRVHSDSGAPEGPFRVAYELRDDETALSPEERAEVARILSWFARNVAVPDRFNRTRSKGFYRRATHGIAWFKPTAREAIDALRALGRILGEHGHPVTEIQERRLGYVVYEDELQVIAEPFRETRTR